MNPRSKPNVLSKVLYHLKVTRELQSDKIRKALWDRNGFSNPTKSRDNYELREVKRTNQHGDVSISFELWQKVDQSILNMKTELKTAVEDGLTKGGNDVRSTRETRTDDTASPL